MGLEGYDLPSPNMEDRNGCSISGCRRFGAFGFILPPTTIQACIKPSVECAVVFLWFLSGLPCLFQGVGFGAWTLVKVLRAPV